MTDLSAMLWKELREFFGNRRNLWMFLVGAVFLGILPGLSNMKGAGPASSDPGVVTLLYLVRLFYALLSAVIVVAQVAPDLVLHERVGRTMDYLLATRARTASMFGAKIMVAAAVGYLSALVNVWIQLVAVDLLHGGPWQWLYLASPQGRIIAFAGTASLALYVSVVATFVGLRAGDQRAASMITLPFVGLLAVPLITGWVTPHFSVGFIWGAAGVVALLAVILAAIGLKVFQRQRIASYLQE